MKAAVLYAPNDIRVERREIPSIGENEILLKVHSAALCGTDLRMWQNGIAGNPPRVLGHEMAGTIEEVGGGVSGYAAGERVAVAPNMGCGVCDLCVSGHSHMCPSYLALGINMDGAFAEYVRVPEKAVRQGNVTKLGPSIGFDEAAAVEALSCVYNGFEGYRARPGDDVLIIGAGPIGIMHAMLCKMAGAARVFLHDLSPDRLAMSASVLPGVIPYGGGALKSFILDETGGRGLDVCVIACPSPSAQAASLELMAYFGRICFFGGLPSGKEIVPLDTNLIHYKQLIITGSTRASLSQYRKCLSLVDLGAVDLRPVITHHYAIDQIAEALAFGSRAGGLKSVINF